MSSIAKSLEGNEDVTDAIDNVIDKDSEVKKGNTFLRCKMNDLF